MKPETEDFLRRHCQKLKEAKERNQRKVLSAFIDGFVDALAREDLIDVELEEEIGKLTDTWDRSD